MTWDAALVISSLGVCLLFFVAGGNRWTSLKSTLTGWFMRR